MLWLSLTAQSALADGTFKVFPSGDVTGVTDWENLNDAFEAANALTGTGEDSTVILASGTFYIHKPLLISNFSGTFKGSGTVMKDGAEGTMITNALSGDPFGLSDWSFTGYEDQIPQNPTFFTFYMDNSWDPDDEANIEVKDLTVHWSAGTTENWAIEFDQVTRDQLGAFFWVPGRLTGTKDPTEVSLVTTGFHNLELTAESELTPGRFGNTDQPEAAIVIFNLVTDPLPDTNFDGIRAYGWEDIKPIIGRQEISNVHIENNRSPIFITGVDDSEVVVRNVMVNNPSPRNIAVTICDSGGSTFTITNLEVTNALGAALVAGHWRTSAKQAPITMSPSSYEVSHSTISPQPFAPAIFLADRVNAKPTGYATVLASIIKTDIPHINFGSVFLRPPCDE